jgi:hypothetical protein
VIGNFPPFIMIVVSTQLRFRVWASAFNGDRHHGFYDTVIYQKGCLEKRLVREKVSGRKSWREKK